MKKRLLTVATVCSLWNVLFAQTDVTDLYIVNNPSFEQNITYSKDDTGSLGTTGDANSKTIEGWEISGAGAWSASASFEYGTDVQLNGKQVPSVGPENAGNAGLGITVGWGAAISYSQQLTLPAGKYKIECYSYNANTATQGKSLLGFVSDNITVMSSKTNFVTGAWEKDELELIVTEETSGKIQVGLGAVSGGSTSNAMVIFDGLRIYKYDNSEEEFNTLKAELLAMKADLNTGLGNYIDETLSSIGTPSSSEEYINGIARLTNLKEEIYSLQSVYKNVNQLYTICNTLLTDSKDATDEEALTTYETLLTKANNDLENARTEQEFNTIEESLLNGRIQYIKYAVANEGAELDYTFLIENITYSLDGWNKSYYAWSFANKKSTEKNNGELAVTQEEGFIETWDGNKFAAGELSYSLTDLPSGLYSISAYTFDNDKSGKVDFFAGDQKVDLDASTELFTLSTLNNVKVNADGILKLGLAVEASATQWVGISHIKLKKTGEIPSSELYAELQVTLQNAKELINEKMNSAIKSLLNDAIANAESLTESSYNHDLISAKSLLNKEIESAKASIADYESFKQNYDKAKAYTDVRIAEHDASINDIYNANIVEIEERYNNGTLGNIAEEVINVHKALAKAVASQEFTEYADYSYAIINNDFEVGDLTGWSLPQGTSSDTKVVKSENNYTTEGLNGEYFFNTWWQGKPLTQTVENLPAGKYTISMLYTGQEPNTSGFYIVANGVPSELIKTEATGVFQTVNTVATVAEDGILNIKVQGSTQSGEYNENDVWYWYKADNFRLTPLVSKVELTVTDAGWATLILPYDAEIPAGLKVYSCSDVVNSELKLTEVNEIKANVPYLVSGAGTYSFSGANASVLNTYSSNVFTGVYNEILAPVGSYVLQNQNGKVAFYKVEEGNQPTIKSNRVYLQLPAESSEINERVLYLDYEVTGISDAEQDLTDKLVDVYNLSGVKVRSNVNKSEALNGLADGIYIVDGNKVVK